MKIWIGTSLLLGLTTVAAITDCRERKVYNKHLCIGVLLMGLWLITSRKWDDISWLGFLFPFAIHFIPFKLRLVSAGDIKLFMVIGLFTSLHFVGVAIVGSYLMAGIYAVVVMLREGCLLKRLKHIYQYLLTIALSKNAVTYRTTEGKRLTIPFALMIHLSILIQIFILGG